MIYYLIKDKDLITVDSEINREYCINELGYVEYDKDSVEVKKLLGIPQKINRIAELKNLLKGTDYKIIKCYEAFMRQQTLPYNLEELSAQRDSWREEINQLEQELSEYEI
jgi:hypothetical protein